MHYDTTQIIMVKDLTKKVLYVRMYESPMPYAVSFDAFDKPEDLAKDGMGTEIKFPTKELAKELPTS